ERVRVGPRPIHARRLHEVAPLAHERVDPLLLTNGAVGQERLVERRPRDGPPRLTGRAGHDGHDPLDRLRALERRGGSGVVPGALGFFRCAITRLSFRATCARSPATMRPLSETTVARSASVASGTQRFKSATAASLSSGCACTCASI